MTDFTAFARDHGLLVEHAIADGRWHRTRTVDKRKARRNGAYMLLGDRGVVRNWATMQGYAIWRSGKPMPAIDRAAMRRLMQRAARDERERHERAAVTAADMLQRATPIVPRKATGWRTGVSQHPYLVRKGHPSAPCLVLDGSLLVPMRDVVTDQLVGMQTIAADGKKLFLPGSRARGAVHRLGRGHETWLVEGLATALSVDAALVALYRRACVLVCFSAGNLVTVAPQVRGPAYVVADADASGAGQQAARATRLPWVAPPVLGEDANDLHLRCGLRAVCEMLQSVGAGNGA